MGADRLELLQIPAFSQKKSEKTKVERRPVYLVLCYFHAEAMGWAAVESKSQPKDARGLRIQQPHEVFRLLLCKVPPRGSVVGVGWPAILLQVRLEFAMVHLEEGGSLISCEAASVVQHDTGGEPVLELHCARLLRSQYPITLCNGASKGTQRRPAVVAPTSSEKL